MYFKCVNLSTDTALEKLVKHTVFPCQGRLGIPTAERLSAPIGGGLPRGGRVRARRGVEQWSATSECHQRACAAPNACSSAWCARRYPAGSGRLHVRRLPMPFQEGGSLVGVRRSPMPHLRAGRRLRVGSVRSNGTGAVIGGSPSTGQKCYGRGTSHSRHSNQRWSPATNDQLAAVTVSTLAGQHRPQPLRRRQPCGIRQPTVTRCCTIGQRVNRTMCSFQDRSKSGVKGFGRQSGARLGEPPTRLSIEPLRTRAPGVSAPWSTAHASVDLRAPRTASPASVRARPVPGSGRVRSRGS